MFDLIFLILIICFAVPAVKTKIKQNSGNRESNHERKIPFEKLPVKAFARRKKPSAKPNEPREDWGALGSYLNKQKREKRPASGRKMSMQERGQDIMDKVNQHIYGADVSKADLMLYKNYLEVEKRTDISKMAREMECTMYQVIRDIRDFQEMGYFTNIEIDDDNYVLKYRNQRLKKEPSRPAVHTIHSGDSSGQGSKASFESAPVFSASNMYSGSVDRRRDATDKTQGRSERRAHSVSYMTMPPEGMEIGYTTMPNDYQVSYMTMPEQGMEIHYNTIPVLPED